MISYTVGESSERNYPMRGLETTGRGEVRMSAAVRTGNSCWIVKALHRLADQGTAVGQPRLPGAVVMVTSGASCCKAAAAPGTRLPGSCRVPGVAGGHPQSLPVDANFRSTFSVILETLLSYSLWGRLVHQHMDPEANTAPPPTVS